MAWRETKPPPKSPEEASRLVIETLKRHQKADVEVSNTITFINVAMLSRRTMLIVILIALLLKGLLAFYGLPLPHSLVELTNGAPPSRPQGLKFELHTIPVRSKQQQMLTVSLFLPL